MEYQDKDASLEDWASARLAITDIEYGLFRVPPQITLEILLIILINGGSCDLSAIYQHVRATHPAIRQHLRLLQNQNLVITDRSSEDRRARTLTLAPKARDMCREYLEALEAFLQR